MSASLNRVFLVGRLTRSPEARSFANGGRVVNFGFAVNERRKNRQTGQYEDEPVFIDVKAFNRGDSGTLADRIEQTLDKGAQILIEGKLALDQWEDKQTGQKRSKLYVIVDNFQYLDPKTTDNSDRGQQRTGFREQIRAREDADNGMPLAVGGVDDGSIPF